MGDSDRVVCGNDPTDREQALTEENARLLEELERAYLQMESYLLASQEEADVAYRELERKNRQLERRLQELEETHTELREAERQLIHSERLAAMGQLAASIVHELRTPLTIIQGNIELFLMDMGQRDEEAERELLNLVLEQCGRLSGLVENTLSFSRRQEIRATSVEVNGVLEDLLNFLRNVKGKGVEVQTEFQLGLPRLRGDPNHLQQVFMNLILNALDAMEGRGSLQITTGLTKMGDVLQTQMDACPYVLALEVGEERMNDRVVYVEIRDEGRGISEKHLERIFEPFYTTKEKGKGTGLGLAICRSILEKYGGNILVASREGEGVRTNVLLPVGAAKIGR